MSLPGIRPIALDDRTGTWCDNVSDDGSSPQQPKQHSTLRLNEASPDRPSHGQTHAQQFRPTRRPPGAQYAQANDSGGGTSNGRLKRSKPVKWSVEEDRRLREAVNKFDEARWKDIASQVETRNHVQCLQRWKKVLKPGLVKGQWSPEEDDRLVSLVERGYRNWGQVASYMEGRTSKQCRERWCHHLDPAVRKGGYTAEEDDLIVYLQNLLGNRWADIAKRLTGRTENAVKIRWKALNRRQRDARNKAAAAAASASASASTGASSGTNSSTSSRTGGREAARTAGRTAAARSVATRETPSRRSGSVKDGVVAERGSRQEASPRGLKSLPAASDTRSNSVTALPESNSAAVQSTEVDDARQLRAIDEEQHARMRATPASAGALRSLPVASGLESAHHETRALSVVDGASDASGGEVSDVDRGVAEGAGEREAQFAGHVRAPNPSEEGLMRLCAALRNVEAMSYLEESPGQSPSSTSKSMTAVFNERAQSNSKRMHKSNSRMPSSPGHEARDEGWSDADRGEKQSPPRQPYEGGNARSIASPARILPPPVGSSGTVAEHNPVRPSSQATPVPTPVFARESAEPSYSSSSSHLSRANSESTLVHVTQTRVSSPRRTAPSPLTMAVEVWTGLSRPGAEPRNGPEVMTTAASVATAAAARPRAMEAEDSHMLAPESKVWLERRREMQVGNVDGAPAASSHLGFSSGEFARGSRLYAGTAMVVKEDPAFVVDDASVVVSMKHPRSRDVATDTGLLERPCKKSCKSPS